MKYTRLNLLILLFIFQNNLLAQIDIEITVDASLEIGKIEPLWGDHWEYHLLYGFGGNPTIEGPHTQYITDPNFVQEMSRLKPRSIRHSIGAFTNPPSTDYYSSDPDVLKNLPPEFYRGPNTLAGANNMDNYHFEYLDSLISVFNSIGAEPFLVLDYMPFTLSSNQTAVYSPFGHLFSWDNSIRNAPPSDFDVFGRVMYHTIKYANENLGITNFEFWNEPDQLAPFNTFFFKGTADDLFQMYNKMIEQIEDDNILSSSIKIGCCSFAFNSAFNNFPNTFLNLVNINNTRLDFLSFHPYSEEEAGYSEDGVLTAINLKDQYVPNSELINAEWGRLSPSFGAANWRSLNYGLDKLTAIINMNNFDIKYAHAATLVAIDDSDLETCCIGIYEVGPLKPKGSAYAYYYMNKFNNHLTRLSTTSNLEDKVLVGRNEDYNSIMIALIAPEPEDDENNIDLAINNIPWSNYKVMRYDLTESTIDNDNLNNLVFEEQNSGSSYSENLDYTSDQNGGRLIIWEIKNETSSAENIITAEIEIFPNPTSGNFKISTEHSYQNLEIINTEGVLIQTINLDPSKKEYTIDLNINPGMYILQFTNSSKNVIKKLVVQE